MSDEQKPDEGGGLADPESSIHYRAQSASGDIDVLPYLVVRESAGGSSHIVSSVLNYATAVELAEEMNNLATQVNERFLDGLAYRAIGAVLFNYQEAFAVAHDVTSANRIASEMNDLHMMSYGAGNSMERAQYLETILHAIVSVSGVQRIIDISVANGDSDRPLHPDVEIQIPVKLIYEAIGFLNAPITDDPVAMDVGDVTIDMSEIEPAGRVRIHESPGQINADAISGDVLDEPIAMHHTASTGDKISVTLPCIKCHKNIEIPDVGALLVLADGTIPTICPHCEADNPFKMDGAQVMSMRGIISADSASMAIEIKNPQEGDENG